MVAKNAVRFDFVVDQYPTTAIKNTERGRRASNFTSENSTMFTEMPPTVEKISFARVKQNKAELLFM